MLVAVRLRAAYREGPAIPTPGAMAMVKRDFVTIFHLLTWHKVEQVGVPDRPTKGPGEVLGGHPGGSSCENGQGQCFCRKSPPQSDPREKCSLYKEVLKVLFIAAKTVAKKACGLSKAGGSANSEPRPEEPEQLSSNRNVATSNCTQSRLEPCAPVETPINRTKPRSASLERCKHLMLSTHPPSYLHS